MSEIFLKLMIKTPGTRQPCHSGVFIVKFEQNSHIVYGVSTVYFESSNSGWDEHHSWALVNENDKCMQRKLKNKKVKEGSLKDLKLTLPVSIPNEKRKINQNFHFHTSFWYLKRFYEVRKGFHKTF